VKMKKSDNPNCSFTKRTQPFKCTSEFKSRVNPISTAISEATHPVNLVSPILSLGIVPDLVSSVPSSLDEADRKQLNSLFGHLNNDIQALTKGLDKTNSVISNLASVMHQQVLSTTHESDTDDGSSTLGG